LASEAHPAPLPPSSPLLRAPLADLDLAVGVLRVAARLGWKTVGDLVAVPPERFEKFGGVGPVSAARVEAKIAAHLGMPWEAAWRSTRATNAV
jgi:DNA-directed RNA polymerase alpha subunit